MNKFAKIFELGDNKQVLVDITISHNDEYYKVIAKTNSEKGTFITAMNFESAELAKQGFDALNYEWAIEYNQAITE